MNVTSQDVASHGAIKPPVLAQEVRMPRPGWTTLRTIWPWVLFVLTIAGLGFASQHMDGVTPPTARVVSGLAVLATQILLLALGETLVIIGNGIDLSAAWVLSLSSLVAAGILRALYGLGWGPVETTVLGILGGAGVALVPGCANGLLVTRWRVPSFVGTLAIGFVIQGIALEQSHRVPVAGRTFYSAGAESGQTLAWIPRFGPPASESVMASSTNVTPVLVILALVALVAVAVCGFLLTQTRLGRHLYAVGGDREAAVRAGIPVTRTIVSAYIASALFAGVAGVLGTAFFGSGVYDPAASIQVLAIAGAVIGGVSLFGGEGTIAGVTAGALVAAALECGLTGLGVADLNRYVIVGAVFLLAIFIGQLGRPVTQ